MGEVYAARDTRLNRSVAIKVLPPHVASDPELRQRFEREAQSIAALNHPHICVLHDVGHDSGLDFLVLEHLLGETLADRLKKGPLSVDQALRYAIQTFDALDKAHRQGIVHRDLKPANIMITPAGVKILDFGLAKPQTQVVTPVGLSQAPTGNVDLTAHGTILGTIQYMAPEQLEGREADARSDIFALGAVLYEMVTGRKAFDGKSQVSLMASILEHEPHSISELQPLSPPGLEHVIQRCLAKPPDDRWQTARDVMNELTWISSGRSQSGAVPVKRRGRVAWIVAANLGVLVALTSVMMLRNSRVPEQVGQSRFLVSTPPTPSQTQLSVSPDGRQIAFVAQSSADAPTFLFVRPLSSVEARPLAGTEGALNPFWSPNSHQIGFSAQGKLKRIDIAGGLPQNICDIGTTTTTEMGAAGVSGGTGGTWNSDGVIVFGIGLGPLKRVSASGGEAADVTTLDSANGEILQAWPFFLPDGRHFLFMAGGVRPESRAIFVGSLDSKERVQVLKVASMPVYAPPGYLLFYSDGTLMAQLFDAKRFAVSGNPIHLADGLAADPQTNRAAFGASTTGVLLYRPGEEFAETQLSWYDRKGSPLGRVALTPGQYRSLSLSPDNKLLAVHRHEEPTGGDIWLLDQERSTFTRLTFTGHNLSPIWSRNGSLVAFSSDRDGGMNIYQKSSTGAGNDEVVLKSGTFKFPEDWAPDGQSILFGEGRAGGVDIYRLPLSAERKPESVVTGRFQNYFSKFSPDGRWIAYGSNESGRPEVYVRPYPQPIGKWQISTQGGNFPRWARNGKALFYLGADLSMMEVDVQPDGAAFKAATPRALFKTNALIANHRGSTIDIPYDVSADAERFLLNERLTPAGQGNPITVVLNWTAALRK
jgi:serine/threonine protein kinase